MDTIEPIVVEQRMRDLRRFAAALRSHQAARAPRSRPGRIRQVIGGWLIDLGCRLRGTAPLAFREALTRP